MHLRSFEEFIVARSEAKSTLSCLRAIAWWETCHNQLSNSWTKMTYLVSNILSMKNSLLQVNYNENVDKECQTTQV